MLFVLVQPCIAIRGHEKVLAETSVHKALTNVAARFARAESTLGALVLDAREDAESPRWLLYISSGVFASRISRSRPRSA